LLNYVWLKASLSQLVSQLNNFFFKFITLCWKDLKTFLGLAMPNQCCQPVEKKM